MIGMKSWKFVELKVRKELHRNQKIPADVLGWAKNRKEINDNDDSMILPIVNFFIIVGCTFNKSIKDKKSNEQSDKKWSFIKSNVDIFILY